MQQLLGLGIIVLLALAACEKAKNNEFQGSSPDGAILILDEQSSDVIDISDNKGANTSDGASDQEGYEVIVKNEGVVRIVPYASCAEIKSEMADAASGNYTIRIVDSEGTALDVEAYCDMVTDQGGWTLITNYVHQAQTNPPTQLRTQDFPLLNGDSLGLDESGTPFWGHVSTQIVAQLNPTEARFECRTSSHNRILDFKTNLATCIDYMKTGEGNCLNVGDNFTPLNNHNALLPADQNMSEADRGNELFLNSIIGRTNTRHWRIGTNNDGDEWECDDNPNGPGNNTIHRIWVR